MVDLGGSENIKKSGVAGEGLSETNFINNSLMAGVLNRWGVHPMGVRRACLGGARKT